MKFILKNGTPFSQATMAIDIMNKSQLLMFRVTIIFITRIIRNQEIKFVGKTCRYYSRQSIQSPLAPGV